MNVTASPSTAKYQDVSPISSDLDSDDDPVVKNARNSIEVAEHDRGILHEEEEREKLLISDPSHDAPKNPLRQIFTASHTTEKKLENRKYRRRERKRRRNATKGEFHDQEGKLMYEMEEGGSKDDISSQASSSSAELDKLNLRTSSTSTRRKNAHRILIPISIALLFAFLTFGAYRVSRDSKPLPKAPLLSNGTSLFAPTTIVISLDGFRADFLRRGITPTLNQFIAEGVSPKYMLPSFPSVTFPNHFTLVTGLYPESHGIVGNTFWDPVLGEEFHYGDPARSMHPKWWAGGEPVWVTAEKQNVESAVHMWPGSEAGMQFSATFVDKFNGTEVLSRKTERILELLDLPSIQDEAADHHRPQFIAAYVPDVDQDGHRYGPNSTEIMDTISNVDVMLHNIFRGLNDRNLTDIVNVVVVSDHGMATTSTDRVIQLDDLIDVDLVEHIDGWPLYGLRPKNPIDLRGLYDRLSVEAYKSPNFEVYLRDEDMPEKYHFSKNDRIAPLWIVPKTGWAIAVKKEFDVKEAKAKGEAFEPKGLHGYDHEHALMRAIFVARGPAFPHKPNSKLKPFQNTEVYNIICDSLGVQPKHNNGTLRLPLKPVGLHSDEPSSSDDEVQKITSEKSSEASDENESKEDLSDFWSYMRAKMKAAMAFAHKIVAGLKASDKNSEPKENAG